VNGRFLGRDRIDEASDSTQTAEILGFSVRTAFVRQSNVARFRMILKQTSIAGNCFQESETLSDHGLCWIHAGLGDEIEGDQRPCASEDDPSIRVSYQPTGLLRRPTPRFARLIRSPRAMMIIR